MAKYGLAQKHGSRSDGRAMISIGLIEDDPVHVELVTAILERAGFLVSSFRSTLEFRRRGGETVDLILLDWQLPGESGIDFLVSLTTSEVAPPPVIFLTAHGEEERVVEGLNAGADDYLVKPVRAAELVARVQAVLRRNAVFNRDPVESYEPFEFHLEKRQALLHGEAVNLSSREYDLLLFLFQRNGRIVSREVLLRQVWRVGPDVNTRTVDTYVSRLRRRLGLNGENGWRLAGIYQHGYRLLRADIEKPIDA